MPACFHENGSTRLPEAWFAAAISDLRSRAVPRAAQERGSGQANHGAFFTYFWEVITSGTPILALWPGDHDRPDRVIGIGQTG
jgi:hypothetical protein